MRLIRKCLPEMLILCQRWKKKIVVVLNQESRMQVHESFHNKSFSLDPDMYLENLWVQNFLTLSYSKIFFAYYLKNLFMVQNYVENSFFSNLAQTIQRKIIHSTSTQTQKIKKNSWESYRSITVISSNSLVHHSENKTLKYYWIDY